jgi:3-methylcrotonyl-CoA carboxylase alpha subunit
MSKLAEKLPSILVANRGEIACRVFRTAKAQGLRTIAVYSEADRQAPHVAMADMAVPIGPAPARESYLDGAKIIAAAKASGAAAIHPGYGFLSENAEFAEACALAGVIFVGPPAAAIRAMGLKDASKRLAAQAGVPIVPGYHGEDQDETLLAREAARIGFPVLIKAVAGGGGKGMKRVDRGEDFAEALASARREAQAAFANPNVLVEKYIRSPRHIEVQVFGDIHGDVVHLFERDCSLQRRHQKVIEEAPAPGMTTVMRRAMTDAAITLARAVGYVGAGTVEFIADGAEGLRPDRFYFMEMNTRLQVEHPVTEAVTGLDLVEWQLRVAAGEKLPLKQSSITLAGHAVEGRLYAEDPEVDFLPSTGKLRALRLPEGEGLRIDTGIAEGGTVTPFYDPMIAKIIAHGPDRGAALARLAAAFARTLVAGPRTNVAFLRRLCLASDFQAGAFDTGFIDRNLEVLGAVPQPLDAAAISAGIGAWLRNSRSGGSWQSDPWQIADGFALTGRRNTQLRFHVGAEVVVAEVAAVPGKDGGIGYDIALPSLDDRRASKADHAGTGSSPDEPAQDVTLIEPAGDSILVVRAGRQTELRPFDPLDVDIEALDAAPGEALVKSPMHGKVVAIFVTKGDAVRKGQRLAIIEAMKMEHVLVAPRDGCVAEIGTAAGQQIGEGARLLSIVDA